MQKKFVLFSLVVAILCLAPAGMQASISRINHDYFSGLEELQDFTVFEAAYFNESYGKARDILDQIIYNYPDEIYLYYIRGSLSLELEDYAAVRSDMNEYLNSNPNDIKAYQLNMIACAIQEDYEEALVNCRAGLALDANDPQLNEFYQKLAEIESQRAVQEKMAEMSGLDILAQMQTVADIVNEERQKEGLGLLKMHDGLSQAAMQRAEEIVSVFSHTRPDGESFATVMKEYDIPHNAAGENIAAGMPTPEAVMMGWMESPGHRSNIMKPEYKYIGVGYVYKNGSTHWVQLFMN